MKLVRPENEPIRRPVQLDRLREQLGVQFLPGELSLEPVRPVILTPSQVVASKVKYVHWTQSTTQTTPQYYAALLGHEEFPYVLFSFWARFTNTQAGSTFRIFVEGAESENSGKISFPRILPLTQAQDVSGGKEIVLGDPEYYWLSGHIIPAGASLAFEVYLASDGATAATVDLVAAILPVYQ